MGAFASASSSTDNLTYSLDCLHAQEKDALAILAQAVMQPKRSEYEVKAALKVASTARDELLSSGFGWNEYSLMAAAFGGRGLGAEHFLPAGAKPSLQAVNAFHAATHVGGAITVVGCSADPAQLTARLSELLTPLPSGQGLGAPAPDTLVPGFASQHAAGAAQTVVSLGVDASTLSAAERHVAAAMFGPLLSGEHRPLVGSSSLLGRLNLSGRAVVHPALVGCIIAIPAGAEALASKHAKQALEDACKQADVEGARARAAVEVALLQSTRGGALSALSGNIPSVAEVLAVQPAAIQTWLAASVKKGVAGAAWGHDVNMWLRPSDWN